MLNFDKELCRRWHRTSGGKAYLSQELARIHLMIGQTETHHDRNAIMNPNQANANTLPCLSIGLRTGIERAFPLTGFISGACQRVAILNPMVGNISVSK
jgi:hypothetical protein